MPAPVTLERYVGPALYVHERGDVTVYEGSFVAGQVIPCHVHADPVISLVLEGDGVEVVAARTRLVTTQDLLLTPAYADGKRPLSMIALDAGFADQSHFTRVFRRAFGETPGQYARSLRGR